MIPLLDEDEYVLYSGDCLDVLRAMPDTSVDAVVTDPPYGLSNTDPAHVAETITRWASGDREYMPEGRGFMGKAWDAFVPPPAVWDECFRVLKPGGHLLTFSGSRTIGLMELSVRLAGFDIRDSIAWLYGSGFPKSMDVSKAIDKAARGVPQGGTDPTSPNHGKYKTSKTEGKRWDSDSGQSYGAGGSAFLTSTVSARTAQPTSAETADGSQTAIPDATATSWEGWGTALKPAFEPIIVARKPLDKGATVAANVLRHGTGAINIDATRIHSHDSEAKAYTVQRMAPGATQDTTGKTHLEGVTFEGETKPGRWPANVILDESQAAALDEQSGTSISRATAGRQTAKKGTAALGDFAGTDNVAGHTDSGGASRFFYQAKASKAERPVVDGVAHPTVKPLALMRWLVRLVTPPNGTVLDPFAGSGTTLEATILEGFRGIAIEAEPSYPPLIAKRIERSIEW